MQQRKAKKHSCHIAEIINQVTYGDKLAKITCKTPAPA